MKRIKCLIASAITLIVPITIASSAHAYTYNDSSDPNCSVQVLGSPATPDNPYSQFSVNGNQATVNVDVSGDTTCQETITIVSWKAPYGSTNYLPLSNQIFYSSSTQVLGVGTQSLSVAVPNCYFQVDLLLGTSAADNGIPNYMYGQLIAVLQAGNTVCEPTTQTSANITPLPTTPAPTPTPVATTTAVVTTKPTVLVNTGPGNIVGIFAVISIGAALIHRLITKNNRVRAIFIRK